MTRRYRRLFDLRLGGRRRIDADLDAELESHIAMRVADLVRAGWSPDAARHEALARFGNFDAARERLHAGARQREAAMQHRDRLGSIRADVAYAIRQFRRAPAFALLAAATLALGIGATTTIFTLVDRVLIEPLPFPHADRLVRLEGLDSTRGQTGTVSERDWLDWRHASSLESSALYGIAYRRSIVTTDSATRVSAEDVTPDYFSVVGSRFTVGRAFREDEIVASAPVVVISERLWRTLYGADAHLERPLRTATRAYTVVGVVAAGEAFPAATDVWFPVATSQLTDPARVDLNWNAIGRLRPGVTTERAAVELSAIARGIRAGDPTAIYDYGVNVATVAAWLVGPVALYLRLLMGAVVFVLLIVCANVAASGLARASVRAREMAIRTSLGARRGRLVQQMLIEHLMLGVAGGLLGLAGAWTAVHLIVARWGNQIPRASEITPDARILAVAGLASLAAGLSAGVLPALRATAAPPRALLMSGGRTAARGGRNLAGAPLVALEIALALLLLTGAGLLIRSFRSVVDRGIGFETNVATVEVSLDGPRFAQDTARRYMYWEELVAAYHRIPGVRAVGLAQWIPLGLTGQGFIDIGDRDVRGSAAVYRVVNEEFFDALRIPVMAGRVFSRQDVLGGMRTAVINRTMAQRYWPGESPLGKRVRARSMERGPAGGIADWLTVVGVVGDVRTYGLETEPRPEMYVSFRQVPSWTRGMTVLVRGSTRAGVLVGDLRRAAHDVDAHVPVDVGTIDALLQRTLGTRTLTLSLLSAFAGAALILAALGIYGVLSYAVTQRTRELAVRAALGAQRRELLRLVLGAGLRVVVGGMVIGIAASVALTRALDSLLFGVSHGDLTSYAAAAASIFLVCLLAILIPARRATKLDPMIALQAE